MALAISLSSPASNPIKINRRCHRKLHAAAAKNISFESVRGHLIRDAHGGRVKEAKSTMDSRSDLAAYTVLLKSCIRTRNFKFGQEIHSELIESGIELDTIVQNSLITLYAKSGDWRKAEQIFCSMGELSDLVSWSAMISCYSLNGLNLEAISLYIKMLNFGEAPNEYCFSAVLRACSDRRYSRTGLAVFGFLLKTGYFGSDVCVGCALIEFFLKGYDDFESANKVFDKMPEKNSVSWTLMITRFSQMGFPMDAIELFIDMVGSGFHPDQYTFSSCLSACTELGNLWLGRQLHGWVIKNGMVLDVCVGCCLTDMYVKSSVNGCMDESRKVFDRMSEHNVMSWTAIITGYVQNDLADEAIELYRRMITEGKVEPNHFTFSALLKACGDLFNPRLGEIVYAHAVKLGLASVNCVGNSLISMYTRNDRMDNARAAFELLCERSLVSYNALIDGYRRTLDSQEAFELLNQVESHGFGTDSFTFASLLSGAASVGAVGKGEQLHARLIKAGLQSNLCVSNALISMYTRCGDIQAGFQIFCEMEDPNVVSWTSIITGFAKHGSAETAITLFRQMLEAGIEPNEVTYVAILSACSHAGLVDEAWKHFRFISENHRLRLRMEHYACMVDVLGRSGLLESAISFINSMPCEPDALVWRTLLGACLVHGNIELGEFAAEMVLKKQPNDPAAHVLLSNLYASKGYWDKTASIRKTMKTRNLVKEAGSSWIEVGNKVHKFHVGDAKHPEAAAIYAELDRIAIDIQKIGYRPETSYVLHEIEEEEMEKYVFHHSEKIALAYGLITTAKKVIRIFNNLRVCGDCHNVMKYASLATGREIVVRDSNRFHHFKDGSCSCNDYW